MDADSIPTKITGRVYDLPAVLPSGTALALSQNDAAYLLAHFWPELERHMREQAVRDVFALTTQSVEGSEHYRSGWETGLSAAVDRIRETSDGTTIDVVHFRKLTPEEADEVTAAIEAQRQEKRALGRAVSREKVGGLLPGQLGLNVADEIADAVLDAAGL